MIAVSVLGYFVAGQKRFMSSFTSLVGLAKFTVFYFCMSANPAVTLYDTHRTYEYYSYNSYEFLDLLFRVLAVDDRGPHLRESFFP